MAEIEEKGIFLKNNVSNIDLYVLAHELNQILQDGFILNVYEIPNNEYVLFKCRTKEGKRNLIIDPKKRINITNFDYPVPPFPTQFTIALRKYIRERRITRIYQYNLDRILIIELKSSEGNPWKFIIEFFSGGNFILVDGEGLVQFAKSYKATKDREIFAKKPYDFPVNKGVDFFNLTFETLKEQMGTKDGELVRILARVLNIGGYIAEEICALADIDKKINVKTLSEAQLHLIYDKAMELAKNITNKTISPRILTNEKGEMVSFEPFDYKIYQQYKPQFKTTFNEAMDDFFSKLDSSSLFNNEVKESSKAMSKTEKILNKQIEQIEHSKVQREETLEQGNVLFQYLVQIDSLINIIMTQKRDAKRSWEEITQALEKGKEKQIPECLLFEKIYPHEVAVELNLEGKKYKLDLKKTALENANAIYSQAKNALRKIQGATVAVEETKKKLQQEKENQDQIIATKAFLLKRPKQKWYEKFRSFISSDGFLVVGGRDASSNEMMVKKYMKEHDLFFHTETRGASVCIIQNPDKKEIPITTLNETAVFGASYSSAWRQGWGSTEIYYVNPDQVSKSPKAGEYLTKGSFFVAGKKNYVSKPYLELAIGVKLEKVYSGEMEEIKEEEEIEEETETVQNEEEFTDEISNESHADSTLKDTRESSDEIRKIKERQITQGENTDTKNEKTIEKSHEEIQYYPQIFSGPVSSISKQTQNYVRIRPNKAGYSASDLAKKIVIKFVNKAEEIEKKWIQFVSLNDIIRLIPPGNSEFSD